MKSRTEVGDGVGTSSEAFLVATMSELGYTPAWRGLAQPACSYIDYEEPGTATLEGVVAGGPEHDGCS